MMAVQDLAFVCRRPTSRPPKEIRCDVLYRGYIGIMEKKMETTILENQMEKKMENEMENGIIIRATLTGKHLRRHSDPIQGLSLKALTGSFEPLVWGSP